MINSPLFRTNQTPSVLTGPLCHVTCKVLSFPMFYFNPINYVFDLVNFSTEHIPKIKKFYQKHILKIFDP